MPDEKKKSGSSRKANAKPVAATARRSGTRKTTADRRRTSATAVSRTRKKASEETPVHVHRTVEPSQLAQNAKRAARTVWNTVRSRKFWMWVATILVTLAILLLAWWQWQRSYVAVVGGQYLPVTMMDEQLRANYGNNGVNSIIQQQLILQEAHRKKINISDKQINDQLSKIKQSSGGETSYREQLKQLGIAEDLLRTQVKVQLMREALLKDKIQVSDQEINDYYEQNKATIDPEGATGVAGLKDQIHETLRQQKLDSATPDYVDSLKQRTDVQVHLDHVSLSFADFFKQSVYPLPGDAWNFIIGKK